MEPRELREAHYSAPKTPVLFDIKPCHYLTISGKGAPGGELFLDKVRALYGVAFTLKMARKYAGEPDYSIGKLEAQWCCGDTGHHLTPRDHW
jgi:hypothetical protein